MIVFECHCTYGEEVLKETVGLGLNDNMIVIHLANEQVNNDMALHAKISCSFTKQRILVYVNP